MKLQFMIIQVILLIISCQFIRAEILINETCSSNYNNHFDEDYSYSDWIEIYNSGDTAVNLSDYRISDSDDYEAAWIFPDTILAPKAYILVYASDKNRSNDPKLLVKAGGEGIISSIKSDSFHFGYIKVAGDFDIEVDIQYFRSSGLWAQTGLIIRESLYSTSKYAGILSESKENGKLIFQYRSKTSRSTDLFFPRKGTVYPNEKLRLKAVGDTIFSYNFQHGYYWTEYEKIYMPRSENWLLGLAVSSSNSQETASASFKSLKYNGQILSFNDLEYEDIDMSPPGQSRITTELHTDFKLSCEEETIRLWNSDSETADIFHYKDHRTNISSCRFPDGNENIDYNASPTPGYANTGGAKTYTNDPVFSKSSGFYDNDINISLKADNASVYYTLDGSEPHEKSDIYNGDDIAISKSTVLRAKAFGVNQIASRTVSHTYIISETSVLPIVSIATDSLGLYDPTDGLFSSHYLYSDKEVTANFSYWRSKASDPFSSDVGLRVHGGASRDFSQKSLRIYSRNEIGEKEFTAAFFGENALDSYDKIVLRNSGQDWTQCFIRDGLIYSLTEDLLNVDVMEFQPAICYLNGKFWGIINIRPRLDEEYYAEKYDIDKNSINHIENDHVLLHGSSAGYHELYNTILSSDMTAPDAFSILNDNICIDNLAKYLAIEFYAANSDWADNNIKVWNSSDYDNKWRWSVYDMDLTFGACSVNPYLDMFNRELCQDTYFAKLLSQLLKNKAFSDIFCNICADLLNSNFLPERVFAKADSLAGIIRPEVHRQQTQSPMSIPNWESDLLIIKEFAQKRPEYLRKSIIAFFNLTGRSDLELSTNIESAGQIKINSLVIDSFPRNLIYFVDIPIELTAIPAAGYKFVGWSDQELPQEASISVFPSETCSYKALFAVDISSNDDDIVINEIMYKQADSSDSGDWIELYNKGNKNIDLSCWILKDNQHDHVFVFDSSSVLDAGDYLIICKDSVKFNKIYSVKKPAIGNLNFGYGSDDIVRLYNSKAQLVDSVNYCDRSPWPDADSYSGFSLELIHPDLDNSIAKNWEISPNLAGSPGYKNYNLLSLDIIEIAKEYSIQCFPNPVQQSALIEYYLPDDNIIEISLFHLNGEKIRTIRSAQKTSSGFGSVIFRADKLAKGSYFIQMKINNSKLETLPIIIIE